MYGSVLAATVVVSAGDLRTPAALAVLLLVSGVVFWIAHVYAATVAGRHGGWHVGSIRAGMRHEWPVAFAAVPPAIAAAVCGLVPGVSVTDGAWAALLVAIGEQQLWGYAAVGNAKLSGAALTGTVLLNVVMGVIIVALKFQIRARPLIRSPQATGIPSGWTCPANPSPAPEDPCFRSVTPAHSVVLAIKVAWHPCLIACAMAPRRICADTSTEWWHPSTPIGEPGMPVRRSVTDALPGVAVVRSYRAGWLRKDVVAGLILTALLVPQGMAYAELAGLPPITGLYTSILCLVGYAVFGPSKVLVLGPDSSLGPMIAACIIPLVAANGDPARAVAYASILAVMVGAITVLAGIFCRRT